MDAPEDRFDRVAVFGGVYSNHLALAAAAEDARARGAEALFCLGDLGGFGPNPDKVFPILRREDVRVVQGNYDDSIGRGLDDCRCGYTDPRDNHYARLAYDYALSNTSGAHRRWLAALPPAIRFRLGSLRVLACHGSPRQVNEFLWETTTPSHFLAKLAADAGCDVILGGHTGIHWTRRFAPRGWYVNGGGAGTAGERRAHLRLVCYGIGRGGPAGCRLRSGPLRSRGAGPRDGGRGHL